MSKLEQVHGTPLSDQLIHRICPAFTGSTLQVAMALGVPADRVDTETKRVDIHLACLKKWCSKHPLPTVTLLKNIVEKAVRDDCVAKRVMIENPILKDDVSNHDYPPDDLMMDIAMSVIDTELFAIGHLGLMFEEYKQTIPFMKTSAEQIREVLVQWRQLNQEDYSVVKLIHCMEEADDDVITNRTINKVKGFIDDHLQDEFHSDEVTPPMKHQIDLSLQPSWGGVDCDVMDSILSTLTQQYKASMTSLCPFPWIPISDLCHDFNSVYIDLNLAKSKTQRNNSADKKQELININDIFMDGVKFQDRPPTMLIVGEPGSGKSTLCKRLAFQWATKDQGIQKLNNYDLLLLVNIALITKEDKNIYDYIRRELILDDLNVQTIHQQKVLFILDGYDELSGNKRVLTDLLERKLCPKSTIIVTSRPGQTINMTLFSKAFDMARLTQADVNKFLGRIRSPTNTSNTNKIELIVHPLSQLLTTPLFLWFYVALGDELFNEKELTSRTNLYRSLVNGVLTKAKHRLEIEEDECQLAFEQLKSIAYNCLRAEKLHFPDKLNYVESNLGFLQEITGMSTVNFTATKQFKFIHKSILEFLATQYIVDHFTSDIAQQLLVIPDVHDLEKRRSSLTLFFACGLVSDVKEIEMIFDQLLPTWQDMNLFTDIEHSVNHFTLQCIAEVEDAELCQNLWRGRVQNDLTLLCYACTPYCSIGLKRLTGNTINQSYKLTRLQVLYMNSDTNTLGEPSVLTEVLKASAYNVLMIDGVLNEDVFSYLDVMYDDVRLDLVHICTSATPDGKMRNLTVLTKQKNILRAARALYVVCRNSDDDDALADLLPRMENMKVLTLQVCSTDDDVVFRTLATSCFNIEAVNIRLHESSRTQLLDEVNKLTDEQRSKIHWKLVSFQSVDSLVYCREFIGLVPSIVEENLDPLEIVHIDPLVLEKLTTDFIEKMDKIDFPVTESEVIIEQVSKDIPELFDMTTVVMKSLQPAMDNFQQLMECLESSDSESETESSRSDDSAFDELLDCMIEEMRESGSLDRYFLLEQKYGDLDDKYLEMFANNDGSLVANGSEANMCSNSQGDTEHSTPPTQDKLELAMKRYAARSQKKYVQELASKLGDDKKDTLFLLTKRGKSVMHEEASKRIVLGARPKTREYESNKEPSTDDLAEANRPSSRNSDISLD